MGNRVSGITISPRQFVITDRDEDWKTITTEACDSLDEHVIKLVDVSKKMYTLTHHDLYRKIAADYLIASKTE